eukprot:COSAG06_NODE_35202_length_463_cov_0.552198_1_plen_109_part_10
MGDDPERLAALRARMAQLTAEREQALRRAALYRQQAQTLREGARSLPGCGAAALPTPSSSAKHTDSGGAATASTPTPRAKRAARDRGATIAGGTKQLSLLVSDPDPHGE